MRYLMSDIMIIQLVEPKECIQRVLERNLVCQFLTNRKQSCTVIIGRL